MAWKVPKLNQAFVLLPREATHSTVLLWQVVCLSVTLRYHGHIGWNCSKIISRLVSLACDLGLVCSPQTPTSRIYSKGNTLKFLSQWGRVQKMAFGVQKLLKCGKKALKLLLRTNRKSSTRFWLVSQSMTLDDLVRSLCTVSKHVLMVLFLYF